MYTAGVIPPRCDLQSTTSFFQCWCANPSHAARTLLLRRAGHGRVSAIKGCMIPGFECLPGSCTLLPTDSLLGPICLRNLTFSTCSRPGLAASFAHSSVWDVTTAAELARPTSAKAKAGFSCAMSTRLPLNQQPIPPHAGYMPAGSQMNGMWVCGANYNNLIFQSKRFWIKNREK
jgi:hypothetical protein